jgi:hypothetical protein
VSIPHDVQAEDPLVVEQLIVGVLLFTPLLLLLPTTGVFYLLALVLHGAAEAFRGALGSLGTLLHCRELYAALLSAWRPGIFPGGRTWTDGDQVRTLTCMKEDGTHVGSRMVCRWAYQCLPPQRKARWAEFLDDLRHRQASRGVSALSCLPLQRKTCYTEFLDGLQHRQTSRGVSVCLSGLLRSWCSASIFCIIDTLDKPTPPPFSFRRRSVLAGVGQQCGACHPDRAALHCVPRAVRKPAQHLGSEPRTGYAAGGRQRRRWCLAAAGMPHPEGRALWVPALTPVSVARDVASVSVCGEAVAGSVPAFGGVRSGMCASAVFVWCRGPGSV